MAPKARAAALCTDTFLSSKAQQSQHEGLDRLFGFRADPEEHLGGLFPEGDLFGLQGGGQGRDGLGAGLDQGAAGLIASSLEHGSV